MSTSDSTIKGKHNEVVGKFKQGVGEAVGNDRLANSGAAEQVKGNAQQAWGSVKESVHDSVERGEANARDSATSTAEEAKRRVEKSVR